MKALLVFTGAAGVLIGVGHLIISLVRGDQQQVLVAYDAIIVGILVLK